MALTYDHVFKPGAYPEYTYVSRNYEKSGISYELRLKQALRTSGCLTSLVGPSKMGKTILCENVIGFENIVEVSGADFHDDSDFWAIVAAKVEMPYAGEITTEKRVLGDNAETSDKEKQKYILTKDKVIEYYKENNKVLVIDDFHYASKEMQVKIAYQLKDAIRREMKIIVVSLPHRSDDTIRRNADLSGRLSLINIDTWKKEDLKEIALKGFGKLDMSISNDIADQLAVECLTSPQLMQYICLSICTLLEDKGETKVTQDIIETACRFTTDNFNYVDIVKLMAKGPNTRGNNRKSYITTSNKKLDMYGLIIEALAKNPPLMEIDIEEMHKRIVALLPEDSEKPNKQTVKEHLSKLQNILTEKEEIFRSFEWKDGTLYILDPLFLFYLRWGRLNE